MSTPETPSRPPRKWWKNLILLLLASAAAGWAFHFVRHLLTHEETEDAYVTGTIHTISSRLPGVVTEILVAENTDVAANQPLVKLDTRDLDLRIEQTQVAIQQARATVSEMDAKLAEVIAQNELAKSGVALAKANVVRDQARLDKAHRDLKRAEGLKAVGQGGAISEASYDEAKSNVDTAEATLTATNASLEAANAYIGTAEAKEKFAHAEIEASKAQLKAAESNLKDAELQRSYATITAPVSGRISRKAAEIGNRIQPGQALFALVEQEVWVQANFKETQLAGLHVGSEVEIQVDALPGRQFKGHIDSFSAASGAQFALLPPDNATGNFTKVVQRVPVKILFDADSIKEVHEQIRPGISVVVSIAIKE
ncbi:MAG: HlyD family secretion protein [Verrucomicrobiaceae bacterium]|nr:HlyD family secretion protein [Verrucomicrobiaceae bacterium]